MKHFLLTSSSLVRNAEAGAGSGGPPAAAAGAGSGIQPPAAGGLAPAAGAGAPPDPAKGAVPPPEAGPAVDYWPDGLDAALKGADGKASLDNVAKALKGYRDRDASKGVPEKPEGYLDFANLGEFKIDDKNQPHFKSLVEDPAYKAITSVAHKHGVGKVALAEMYQTALNTMAEAGLLEAPLDVAAEMAALVPEAAKTLPKAQQDVAVQARLNANYEFLTLAQANLGLDKGVSDYAEMMLGDSAKGHQFLEWVKTRMQAGGGGGGGPGAHGQPGGGTTTRETLRAEMAALKPSDPDYKAKSAALDEKYKKHFGD